MENIFRSESYEKLYKLYNDIIGSKEDGLRPKSLDKYIAEIQVTNNGPSFAKQELDYEGYGKK